MEKIIAILSATVLLLAVTSCATTKAAKPAKDAAATEETPAVQAIVKNPAPTADVVVLDNFEEGNYFSIEESSTATSVDVSTEWASEGTSSLALEVGPNTNDSGKWAMCKCTAPAEVDWSTYKYIYFDVKNATSAPVKVYFCCMGGAWSWYQNPNEVEVGEEVINVKMSLEETMGNGKMLYGSEDSMNMVAIIFAVDGATDGGYVYIDNVRLAND